MRLKPEHLKPEKENKGIIDLLTNLDKDKIKGILGGLQDNTYETDERLSPLEQVLDIARQNPELTKEFLSKIGGKLDSSQEDTYES